ncbi:MAG: DNA topoisomerase IV subunit B, partial [Acholeplasmatales bacterium]|nr:DNA topoisomerase IV subunit B [Acholeplasmatales bacterium]
DDELSNILAKKPSYMVQRYKGLGEMNASQLWETTMDPARRNLIQVRVEDMVDSDKKTQILMGENVSLRKSWIDNNISFDIVDNFEIKKDGEE